ncbi:MAG: hypothetical protein Q9M97_09180 [Candidatus Gracilibacteria bacterium]|nr:hypothetical protein [Candidatus Gracilibacteria bacterium]
MDELNGKETYNSIDFDQDGDQDLLYMVNGELYLKENFNIQENKNSQVETPIILNINNNKYFNGEDFIEAINGFKEINSDSGFLNLIFASPTDKSINHFSVEYYTIVDKFLNKEKIDGINKNYIDAFIENNNGSFENDLIKEHSAYINHIGDIPAVRLDTYEIQNIGDSLSNNNNINISATTPIYTANSSAKIKFYIGKDEEKILEKIIPKNSSIRFKEKITIIAINGNIYSKGNKKINLVGDDIKKYIGLPIFNDSEFSIIPDLKNRLNPDLANIEIKYSSGYKKTLDFTDITSYSYYNLGVISNDYLIRIPTINDYYYGKIYAIKDDIRGTSSSQKLFSPQLASDKLSPEIEGLGEIRIPVYQEKIVNLKQYIYENSGINGIKNIEIKLKEDSNILPDNYTINKSISNISIDFGKFNKLFKETIEIILEDNNGNKSINPIDFGSFIHQNQKYYKMSEIK